MACIENQVDLNYIGIKSAGVLMADGDKDNEGGHGGDAFVSGSAKWFIVGERVGCIEPP